MTTTSASSSATAAAPTRCWPLQAIEWRSARTWTLSSVSPRPSKARSMTEPSCRSMGGDPTCGEPIDTGRDRDRQPVRTLSRRPGGSDTAAGHRPGGQGPRRRHRPDLAKSRTGRGGLSARSAMVAPWRPLPREQFRRRPHESSSEEHPDRRCRRYRLGGIRWLPCGLALGPCTAGSIAHTLGDGVNLDSDNPTPDAKIRLAERSSANPERGEGPTRDAAPPPGSLASV